LESAEDSLLERRDLRRHRFHLRRLAHGLLLLVLRVALAPDPVPEP
jgi:hypothetical protein